MIVLVGKSMREGMLVKRGSSKRDASSSSSRPIDYVSAIQTALGTRSPRILKGLTESLLHKSNDFGPNSCMFRLSVCEGCWRAAASSPWFASPTAAVILAVARDFGWSSCCSMSKDVSVVVVTVCSGRLDHSLIAPLPQYGSLVWV